MIAMEEFSSTAKRGRCPKRSEGRRGCSASALPIGLNDVLVQSLNRADARYPLRALCAHLPRSAVEESISSGVTS